MLPGEIDPNASAEEKTHTEVMKVRKRVTKVLRIKKLGGIRNRSVRRMSIFPS